MGVDPNLRTPYAAEYSLGIQHAITHALSLDIGYVGNKGTKFVSNVEINEPNCTTAAAAASCPDRPPSHAVQALWALGGRRPQ